MKAGIAPSLLLAQVQSTAGWLWSIPAARAVTDILDRADEAETARTAAASNGAAASTYLRFLLAAHYATVATFVPTDVDARIRHHAWASFSDAGGLDAALASIDEIARADVTLVSARFLSSSHGVLSGHDGEWFSVRAGALGRAIDLGATEQIDRLVSDLDAEVERESRIFSDCDQEASAAGAQRLLAAATIIAHNLGDLSRVVEAWTGKAAKDPIRARYVRLGHADQAEAGTLASAGALNKELMARENHRFLPLRKPRALRSARELLLPIGPWLDAWGERIARSEALEPRDRAEVVAALLEIHAADPKAQGCLRALAGIHRTLRGGLESLADDVPARLRKEIARGLVREALDVTEDHFAARMKRRYELFRASGYRPQASASEREPRR